ncbi:AAA family ATPase [bacterium]|nr:AAA family ATPase [bacterium]
MELSELQAKITELEQQIAELPAGSVTKKTINGNVYFYHRWTENKKRREKYIPAEEVDSFRKQIERRKALEKELKALQKQLPMKSVSAVSAHTFATNIRTGEALRTFSASVRKYRKRECFRQLHDYIYGEPQDKVFILYGLRRTGKTTIIRQIFVEMSDAELSKAAFIQITARDTLADVNRDLKALEEQGFRYVFLDEVTLMEDFIEGAALFSDVFAACGMKIVLSGTDSLGFLFTEDEQLYDRCILLHTTFIPYREFESVLGIHGIDEYIRFGGTMSLGVVHYNETSTFASKKSADEYVDTAIARNIQHSLRCYQYEGHFRHLRDLYDRNELTSAIIRVVEDINHRFTLEVLTQDFKSHDLGISASNLRRDRENPTDILDHIDLAAVTESLRQLLDIRNRAEQTVALNDVHAAEIKEYLDLLDLTQDIDVRYLPDVSRKSSRTVIAQPGLRYAQADALIRSLLLDETFSALSLPERTAVQERILSEIRGRMLEDIVLLETKLANPQKQVFVLQFPVGEFDMVVFDPVAGSCHIFEIKHSAEIVPQQYRHLIDEEKCAQAEHRYGPITGKTVLYRGKNRVIEGIQYQNVEEYLRHLIHAVAQDGHFDPIA